MKWAIITGLAFLTVIIANVIGALVITYRRKRKREKEENQRAEQEERLANHYERMKKWPNNGHGMDDPEIPIKLYRPEHLAWDSEVHQFCPRCGSHNYKGVATGTNGKADRRTWTGNCENCGQRYYRDHRTYSQKMNIHKPTGEVRTEHISSMPDLPKTEWVAPPNLPDSQVWPDTFTTSSGATESDSSFSFGGGDFGGGGAGDSYDSGSSDSGSYDSGSSSD